MTYSKVTECLKDSNVSLMASQSTKSFFFQFIEQVQNQMITMAIRLQRSQKGQFMREFAVSYKFGGLVRVNYNNLRTTCKKSGKMNTYSTENCFNPYSFSFPHFATFFCSLQPTLTPNHIFKNTSPLERNSLCQYRLLDEVESPSFQTRLQPSIIIFSNTELSQPKRNSSPNPKSTKKAKPIQKKVAQKQSRNVASNLMRIFLKNIIELKFYDQRIQKMINAHCLNCTLPDFHTWLTSFGINYKNYIRFTQIKRVLRDTKNQDLSRIFRMVLRQYTKGEGVEHCLTSKRIQKSAISMHLSGLKDLLQQATHE